MILHMVLTEKQQALVVAACTPQAEVYQAVCVVSGQHMEALYPLDCKRSTSGHWCLHIRAHLQHRTLIDLTSQVEPLKGIQVWNHNPPAHPSWLSGLPATCSVSVARTSYSRVFLNTGLFLSFFRVTSLDWHPRGLEDRYCELQPEGSS